MAYENRHDQALGLHQPICRRDFGALMWTCVTVIYLIAGAVFTVRLLSPHRSEFAIPQFNSRRIAVRHTDLHRMEAV